MKTLVFVPGIMGSELRNQQTNQRVWPPTLTQIVTKSLSAEALLDEHLAPIKPVSNIARFYPVYSSLLNDLERCGYSLDGASGKQLIAFAYDWRQDNAMSAERLAERLDLLSSDDEIVLLAHSMGGLVCRYLIESGDYASRPWFRQIKQLITMGTPHHGAASALKMVAGLEDNVGIKKDQVKLFADDPRYAAAYQLVASADSGMTVTAGLRNKPAKNFDPFDQRIVAAYQLSKHNIDIAHNFWAKLDLANRPSHIDYFAFLGSAHRTLSRMEWTGRELREVQSKASGDGTVPISGAQLFSVPHSFSQKNHASIFTDRSTRFELFKMLGAPANVVPQAAADIVAVGAQDAVGLSIDRTEYAPRDTIEVGLSFTQPREDLRCVVEIMRLDMTSDDGVHEYPAMPPVRVKLDQAKVEQVRFEMMTDLTPGVYELICSSAVDDPQRTMFTVAEQ
jgi:pimeloyl-ACP methyl ester carboxylesterase